ncbi:MAG: aldo/keto reductase [Bifidobacterium tibiigranuli]|jgi:diketogulonate reductase-like aldo/keto reductase|nr:aldo/keto reductase [Bifidobacterium tibiigranuli]MCI1673600.1 aldo/keto reductase [Bifidobacterium tibiigranuli]MCI1713805.1 aldo/keto reductase [Bifidobacterium tibiigranuli]MCI1834624.1 aldo/keto reductase [Bifidobacterium tibiigranuli]
MTLLNPPEIPTRTAHDGLELPAIGFGTYKVEGREGVKAIESALEVGYRLIDSAFNYENEGTVGRAIRESEVPREQIIVTSKLPGRHHRYDEARVTIEESVERMGLDYIDLYLIHWPNPSKGLYLEAWKALIDAQEQGIVKHIGVSNFLPGHIDQLTRLTGVTPSVNQVETHPYFQQREQRAYDDAHGIITEAWSPLGRASQMLQDPAIRAIAEKHSISPVQAVLRWHVQLGDVAIPKSMNRDRQRANIDLTGFELDEQDMADFASLDNPEGRSAAQNPQWYEEF